jgi:hypothetical protein
MRSSAGCVVVDEADTDADTRDEAVPVAVDKSVGNDAGTVVGGDASDGGATCTAGYRGSRNRDRRESHATKTSGMKHE